MSRVRRRQGLAAWRKALHLRMRRLRQADLGDGRHDHAWFEAAFARMVLGRLSHGHPFEWDFGAAIAKTARARLLQVGVAAVRQAAPRHGCAGPRAARRPRRGRRGRDPVADQGRSGLRRRRPLAPGQNVGRRRRRSRKRRPRTPSPGRDQGLLRRLAAWLRRRQRRPGRDDQNRRLAVLRPRPRRPARAPCRRRHGRPCRSALGPPRLLQRQDLGARRLSRPAKTASPELPRRIRLPLQPTPNPPRRLPLPSRNRPRPQTINLQYVDHAGSSGIRLSSEYGILADRNLLEVAQTIFGLSPATSATNIDAEAKALSQLMPISDLQDPKKLQQLTERFTATYDLTYGPGSGATTSLTVSSDNSGSSQSAASAVLADVINSNGQSISSALSAFTSAPTSMFSGALMSSLQKFELGG